MRNKLYMITKEDIINILRTYDNVFSLNDGGFALSDEDIEYQSEIILNCINDNISENGSNQKI